MTWGLTLAGPTGVAQPIPFTGRRERGDAEAASPLVPLVMQEGGVTVSIASASVCRLTAIFFLVLANTVMQPLATSAKFVEVEQYETASVEEDGVLHSSLPTTTPKALEDIQAVYPIGMPAKSVFAQAHWLIGKNGATVVLLPQPGTSGSQTLNLSGTSMRREGTVHVHAVAQGARGLAITLDGLLIASDDGYLLKCTYTAQIRGAQHVELLTLRLRTATNPLPMEFVDSTLASLRYAQALDEQSQALEPLLSEPETYIGGMPVPTDFEVTVSGKVDGLAFGPMAGTLLLRRAKRANRPTVDLTLATDDRPVIPGWSFWVTGTDLSPKPAMSATSILSTQPEQESEAGSSPPAELEQQLSGPVSSPGISLMAEGGRLHVAITPAPPFRQVGWYSPDPDHPEDPALVNVDTGEIELRIDGDRISGTIEAEGHVLAGSRPVSSFSAGVEGYRQGSNLLDTITGIVGLRRFSGQWQTLQPLQLGKLRLTQEGTTVKGSFTGEGDINNGSVTNQILNFDWTTPEEGSGRGFIRAAGSGLLVGMRWPQDEPSVSEPIVAVQEQPIKDAKGIAGEYPGPTTDGEALSLRFLAYDLAHADKHREAAKMLTKVVDYYYRRANSAAVDPGSQHTFLMSQAIPLLTLIESAFKAGEYHLLVDALDKALELHRRLSQDTSGLLLFREQVRQYADHLNGTAETIGYVAAAFDRELYTVTGAGIGVNLEELPNAGGFKITGVTPGMPAGRAGATEGDEVVAIDGAATAGMEINEVLSRLRGPAGSVVTLTVQRSGRQLEIELIREPLTHMEHKKREGLAEALAGLREQAAALQHKLNAEAETVNRLLEKASKPEPAIEDLMARIANRQAELQEIRARIIALAERAMADTPNALSLFRRLVDLLERQAQDRHLASELSAAMMTLDLEFEEFERRSESGDFDAGMLVVSSAMVSSVITLEMKLAGRHRLAAQARERVIEAPTPIKTQETLAFFIGWLDRWWSQLVSDPGKIDALHQAQKVYDRYVQLLVEFDLPEKALAASEVARARAFRDLLASRRSATRSPTLGEGAVLASIETAVAPDIEEMRSLVQETGTTVLEYYVLEEKLLVWVLAPPAKLDAGPEAVAVHLHQESLSRVELKTLVEQFMWLVAAPSGAETQEEWFKWLGKAPRGAEVFTERFTRLLTTPSRAEVLTAMAVTASLPQTLYALLETETASVLRTLYAHLIAPLANLLPDQLSQAVTIVPHDTLFRIPFAALARPAGDSGDSDRYLVEDHALAYAPSLGVMQMVRQLNRNDAPIDSPSLLAVVNPAFGQDIVDSDGQPFRPLLQLEADIGYVLDFYEKADTRLLTGMEATPEAVLVEAPSYDVVLFATHAAVLEERPMDSYVALAGGLLRVEDIAHEQRRLKARLVILGACETGLGAVTGDGVNGLARWMIAAGANALMISLWQVPDLATLELIYAFHRAWLKDGMDMTVALREAQLNLLANYPGQVPLWAGFIMMGGWP
jgi:CHAT domain-containing protein